jgi:hypothetical protein
MKRTCLDESTCPIARSLDSIGDWWTLLIVRDAMVVNARTGGSLDKMLVKDIDGEECGVGDLGDGDGRVENPQSRRLALTLSCGYAMLRGWASFFKRWRKCPLECACRLLVAGDCRANEDLCF